MARTFSAVLTPDQLADKICFFFSKGYPNNDEIMDEFHEAPDNRAKAKLCVTQLDSIAPKAYKDLQKVQFDWENWTADEGDGYNGASDLTGFHTLPNGLTYLGVIAGGDWEVPVFFILYYDGKDLRAYIPEDGNHWNKTTKQAYGNSEEADAADVKKRYGSESGDEDGEFEYDPDMVPQIEPEKVIADIQGRVTYNGKLDITQNIAAIIAASTPVASPSVKNGDGFGMDEVKVFVKNVFYGHHIGYVPHLNHTPVAGDYDLLANVIELRAGLPPTYARTALVKTLLGSTDNKICNKRPQFGWAKDKKYSLKFLNAVVDRAIHFLESVDVMEQEEVWKGEKPEDAPPEYINRAFNIDKGMAEKLAETVRQASLLI